MDLSERKRKILHALVEEYINTAEPVGSRAIAKKKDLGLSSATIRNEMADLEEMGYLVQPHTSAGRVPSDEGYKLYVSSLMKRYQLGVEAIEQLHLEMNSRLNQLDRIIKKAGFIAAALTDYTTIVSVPDQTNIRINKIDLINLGGSRVIMIVVTETGVVRNRTFHLNISNEECETAAKVLCAKLSGLSVAEIDFETIKTIEGELNSVLNPQTLVSVMNFVYETISDLDTTDIYVDNAKSILNFPEYSDVRKVQNIFGLLEDKQSLKEVLNEVPEEGIGVKIGAENNQEALKDCSLVTMNYTLDNKVIGKIGIIGPKRMDYAKVFAGLDLISANIDAILKMYNP